MSAKKSRRWPPSIRISPKKRSISDRKSTRLNSSHLVISYAVFCSTLVPCSPRSTLFPYTTLFRSKAEKLPGVRAVVTAEDTIKRPWGAFFADQYILSVGKTRYVGEEVAAVAAIDPDIAEEAIDLRSEEHTSELQSPCNLVCRLLLDTRPVLAEIYTLSLHDALPI